MRQCLNYTCSVVLVLDPSNWNSSRRQLSASLVIAVSLQHSSWNGSGWQGFDAFSMSTCRYLYQLLTILALIALMYHRFLQRPKVSADLTKRFADLLRLRSQIFRQEEDAPATVVWPVQQPLRRLN